MRNERRLIVLLGSLCAIGAGLFPALHLRHEARWPFLGVMIVIVATQVVLLVRMRRRGDGVCPPRWRRLGC